MRHALLASLQRLALVLGLAALIAPAHAQSTYSYTFPSPPVVAEYDGSTQPAGASPVFDRPEDNGLLPPATLSTSGTAVSYVAKTINIPADGNYDLVLKSVSPANWDNFLVIYKGTFDPAHPLTNAVAANDTLGTVGTAGFTKFLLTAGTYVLVATAFSNNVVGSFNLTVTPSPTVGSPAFTVNGTTTPSSGAPTFNRPDDNGNSAPINLSKKGVTVYYSAKKFTVPTTGSYDIFSQTLSPTFDNFTVLYKNAFNPASPLLNAVIANDDLRGSTSSGFTVTLTAGTNYYLVTTSYANGVTGSFTNTVTPTTGSIFQTYTGTTTNGPTFDRPVANGNAAPTALSGSATAATYDAHTFVAPLDGPYQFSSSSVSPTGWDNFALLYQTSFNPASPLTNCRIANDDLTGTGTAGFTYTLTAGQTYVFVTTGFKNTDSGTFSNTIAQPAATLLTYTDALSSGTATTFDRPDDNGTSVPVALSATATATSYKADSFTVPMDGTYNVLSTGTMPTNWNNYTALYNGSFDRANPLTNILLANDNQPTIGVSGFIGVTLTAGTTYTLVTSGATNSDFGDYTVNVSPATIYPPLLTYADMTTLGTGPTFNRPTPNGSKAPTSLSATATAVFYQTHSFTVSATDSYGFTSTAIAPLNWDTFYVLYKGTFDPANPLLNAIIASDGNTFNVTLMEGETYVLVTTGFANFNYGTFHNRILRGSATYPPTIPDNDANGLVATLNVPDSFTVGSLDKVTVTGLNHGWAGDLLATLTHNGVTVELFDRLGAATSGALGTPSDFAGDYSFITNGASLLAVASVSPIPTGTLYAPFLNGTAGQSGMSTATFADFTGMNAQGDWVLKIADLAANITGTYTGFRITLEVGASSVSGNIKLDGLTANAPPQPITFTFRPNNGGADIVRTASIGPDGNYTISSLPLQAYTLHIKGVKYLAANVPVDTTGGNVTGINATLIVGDATDDNTVDLGDFSALVNAYGDSYTPGDPMANPVDVIADFNYDGLVDTGDFGLLVNSYGLFGDP